MGPRTKKHRRGEPSFFWQAALIVLPVVVMAVVGWTAISRDRSAVEHQARERAAELAQDLAERLAPRLADVLTILDLLPDAWAVPPIGEPDAQRRTFQWREWHNSFPEWQPLISSIQSSGLYPIHLPLDAQGKLIQPREYDESPRPPAWFLTLSETQRVAWDALNRASRSASTQALDQAWAGFLNLDPPPAARANAEFIRLRAEAPAFEPWPVSVKLQSFARDHSGLLAESGLPLDSLALAQALQLGNLTQWPAEQINSVLTSLQDAPSLLTPELLRQVQRIGPTNNPTFPFVLKRAWAEWDRQERLRDSLRALRLACPDPRSVTNLWLDFDGQRWLGRSDTNLSTFRNTRASAANEDWWLGRTSHANLPGLTTEWSLFSKETLQRAVADLLRDVGAKIPPYLSLEITLEGEPLGSLGHDSNLETNDSSRRARSAKGQPPSSHSGPTRSPERLLAQAEGRFGPRLGSPPHGLNSSAQHLPQITDPHTTPRPRNRISGEFVERRNIEQQAPMGLNLAAFAVRIGLERPAQLYAQQHQRTLWFGGLILVSALAALAGLLAAWRAFQRQLRLNELKSNFVSSVSHELRAPIASVRLMAESLERGRIIEPSKQREYFGFIVQECRRLSGLIENVLDFSRIEQGRKQYEFEPTDLAALVTQTVKVMETYAAERQVSLVLNLTSGAATWQAEADGKALQQALVNLIDNAIKHSPKGQTVTVGLEMQGTETNPAPDAPTLAPTQRVFHLWVEDHGPGIPPTEQEKIFERFYRLGSELRRETQGVGIGLSIVKHIVQAHDGRVRVLSSPGQGSRFTLELPLRVWNES